MNQKRTFLAGEGDAWFIRNQVVDEKQQSHWEEQDVLLPLLMQLPLPKGNAVRTVEVGCGQGLRLSALQRLQGWQVAGIDPSTQAVAAARSLNVDAHVGTADQLPYGDSSVDCLIYGFCLYLCDPVDLFRIAAEAHRVLRPDSWLVILDFWSPIHRSNDYHHLDGIKSFKADRAAMFSWHPSYVITDHRLRHHSSVNCYTDDGHEWVSTTVLRRHDG